MQNAAPVLSHMAQVPKPETHDIEAYRNRFKNMIASMPPLEPKQEVTTKVHKVKTRDGATIDVIQVSPKERKENGSAVVHIHGGGMISGTAHMFVEKGIMASFAEASGVDFFTVDYRLAPENNLDGLVNDGYDGLEWVLKNAASLGVDANHIGLMGESAGAGIAVGVALQARDTKLTPALRKLILVYPMLDDRNLKPDPRLAPTAFWTYEVNLTGWSAVLGKGVAGTDKVEELVKYAVPARVKDLSGLPDTYIDVGQMDIFIAESLEFAKRLHDAGVQLDMNIYKGMPHAWEIFARDTHVGKLIAAARISAIQDI